MSTPTHPPQPAERPPSPVRRGRGREVVLWALVVLALAAAAVIFIVQPFQDPDPPATARTTATSNPTASKTSKTRAATSAATSGTRAGVIPTRLVIPDLQVDAAVVQVGLDEYGNLGAPSHDQRTKAGWYALGPRPGDGRGNVLMDGHTFVNDSAIFKSDFAEKIHVGMAISVAGADGVAHRYTATTVLPAVNKKDEYPGVVGQYKLYDFAGPERLVIVTCSGSFNWITKTHEDVSIVIADVTR